MIKNMMDLYGFTEEALLLADAYVLYILVCIKPKYSVDEYLKYYGNGDPDKGMKEIKRRIP